MSVAAGPRATVESGSWEHVLSSADVAIIAHYSTVPQASRSVEALVQSLHGAGFATVLVSTSEVQEPLRFNEGARPGLVVRRPNVAYDFGSWAWAITTQPELRPRRTLLLNDSLAGPFADAAPLFREFKMSLADVWGLIGSGQFQWHLQSYCVGYAPGVLGDRAIRKFWRDVRPLPTKQDVIMTYELGQTAMLLSEGFTVDVVVPPGLLIGKELNPAILAWRQLLDIGIPFVKKELIRDPSVAPDAADIPGEIARRYGVDLKEWL